MRQLDDATIERIIEQITRQVLVLLEDESFLKGSNGNGKHPELSSDNYSQHLKPVINAGADRIASTLGILPDDERLAHMIDHTILKPDASQDEIAQLCYEARKYNFASVCVNPAYVKLCSE